MSHDPQVYPSHGMPTPSPTASSATPDPLSIDAASDHSAEVAARNRSHNHHDARLPGHDPFHHEIDQGEPVDRGAKQRLEAVHLVNVRHPDQRIGGEHHDAHAAAEI